MNARRISDRLSPCVATCTTLAGAWGICVFAAFTNGAVRSGPPDGVATALIVGVIAWGVGLWLARVPIGRVLASSIAAIGIALGAAHWTADPEFLSARLPAFDHVIALVFDSAHGTHDGVRVETMERIFRVATRVNSLAPSVWITFIAVGALGTAVLSRDGQTLFRGVRRIALTALLGSTVVYVGQVAVSILDAGRHTAGGPGFTAVGDPLWVGIFGAWVPFTTVLWSRQGGETREPAVVPASEEPSLPWSLVPLAAANALLLTILAVGGDALILEKTAHRPLRILFDDVHSGSWETTSRRFDMGHFGEMAEYNYAAAAEMLAHDHAVSILEHGRLDAQTLVETDVLVIKTPGEPFSPGEIDAVRTWVSSGGRLILVGDHTNLFGMNEKLNRIARGTGIQFRDDAVNDVSGHLAESTAHWAEARGAWRGVRYTQYLTSCSMSVRGDATGLLRIPNGFADNADYADSSYFGDALCGGDEFVGPTWVAAAAPFGAGRMVCFSDSTIFSNFTVAEPGHERILRALVLSAGGRRTLRAGWWTWLLPVCGLLLTIGLSRALYFPGPALAPLMAVVTGSGVGLALGLGVTWLTAGPVSVAYREALEHSAAPRVVAPTRHMNFALLPAIGSREPNLEKVSVSTLMNVLLRGGRVPTFLEVSQEPGTLGRDDVLILINPVVEAHSEGDLIRWIRNARRRGSLVVLAWGRDYARTQLSGASELAQELRAAGVTLDVDGLVSAPRDGPIRFWYMEDVTDSVLGHCFAMPGRPVRERMRRLLDDLGPAVR